MRKLRKTQHRPIAVGVSVLIDWKLNAATLLSILSGFMRQYFFIFNKNLRHISYDGVTGI